MFMYFFDSCLKGNSFGVAIKSLIFKSLTLISDIFAFFPNPNKE